MYHLYVFTTVGAALAYMLSSSAHVLLLFRPSMPKVWKHRKLWSQWLSIGAWSMHLLVLVSSMFTMGTTALLNISGGILIGGLALTSGFMLLAFRQKLWSLGSLILPLGGVSLIPALWHIHHPMLSSTVGGWILSLHILSASLGTALFVGAATLSAGYLFREQQFKAKRYRHWFKRFPSLDRLEKLSWLASLHGFAIYTLSLLLGIVWAWEHHLLYLDARKTLSTLTWLIYALMIQARITVGWHGRQAARLTLVGTLGAISVVFIYLLRT